MKNIQHKKNRCYLLFICIILFVGKVEAQPYYTFPHPYSSGTFTVGNINVAFNYNNNGGNVYTDSCTNFPNYNFNNGGYFTFGFNVPIAGVRIRGIYTTPGFSTIIAVAINGASYTLSSSNISSFNSCGNTSQGILAGGNLVNGNGMITILQPGITSLKVQNNGSGYWQFEVDILPLVTTSNTPCAGNTLNLTSNFGGVTSGVTYSWTGPNGFTSGQQNPSISNITPAAAGTYTVTASNGSVTASQTQVASLNSSVYSGNIYVDSANGNDNNIGTSWATAFKTLSYALSQTYNASCYTLTDSILVAKGTYYPTGTQSGINRDSTFVITRGGLKIYGGFPTGGGTFAQRTLPSSGGAGGGTILSGNINNANNSTDNSYHVMVVAGIAATADSIVVDGLTLTQSYSAGASGTKNINGIDVMKNRGALVVMNDSTAQKTVFNNLSISNNHTVWGAGAWVQSGSSPLFTHCSFTGNTATSGGGGMNVKDNSSPHIINCIFSSNIAQGYSDGGGGLRTETGSQPVITNSSFINNAATNASFGLGGGMYNISSSPVVTHCSFSDNSATTCGGGMGNQNNSSPAVSYCTFKGNIGSTDGGGIYNRSGSSPYITNCLFSGNVSNNGGGMRSVENNSFPKVVNSTFAGNWANTTSNGGGVFSNNGANTTLINCIVYGNNSGATGSNSIYYSLIQGNTGGTNDNLNGNLLNPLFVNPIPASTTPDTLGDYSLQPCSPAINAGRNDSIPVGITTDITNAPRIFNTTVDMGAYEYQAQNGTLASTIYVDSANGNDANNGTTWATAFKTLSTALYKAQLCTLTDSILVAKGTYYPTGVQTGINRDSTFAIKRGGLKIYGGYDAATNTRDITTNPTILSGNINNANDSTDNSYHVMVIAGIAATADSIVVDGLTIQHGNANINSAVTINGLSLNRFAGGGVAIVNDTAHTVFNNCIIKNNTAANPSNANGGGIYNLSRSNKLILSNSAIINNKAGFLGGGLYNTSTSSAKLYNCLISNNQSTNGGGIGSYSQSNCTIINSTIYGNTATTGGAIHSTNTSRAIVANSIVWGNAPLVDALYKDGSSSYTATYSDIQNVTSGAGNIIADPLFVDVSNSNFQLQLCSPAINAGRNDSIPTGITTDIMGNNRIYNNATVDMGAYELQNTPPDYGTIVYVDSANGSDAYEGTSWATAFKTLSYALNATQNTGCYQNVDSIMVAKGTYYPTGAQSGTVRDATFAITRGGLKIYGGYDAATNTRNITTNPTILSGDINNANDSTDNSYHVMVIAGVPAGSDSVLVDGITVTGGNANGSGNYTYGTISTVRSEAGGIYMHTNQELGRKLRIANCSITRNNAMYYGGGLYTQRSSPLIENCWIADNGSGNYGGGIFSYNFSSPLITGCTFHNNSANNSGSAGGALFQNDSTVYILHSVFTQNRSGSGGAARLYRAINNGSPNPGLYAEANVFADNKSISNDGGALSLVMGNGTDTISNNLFAGNTTTTDVGNNNNGGAAMVQENGTATFIANNTFYGNTAASLSGAIRFKSGGSHRYLYNNIFNNNYAGATQTDTSSQTGTTVTQQMGNLFSNTDALFVNTQNLIGDDGQWATDDDGLQLNGCSPAVNAGNSDSIPASITTDITGAPRVYDGLIDIGAYEYQNTVTVVNGNAVYVDSSNGNDNNDGISWGTAFKTVAHALALVQRPGCYSGMDSILVAKGTYYPIAQPVSGLPAAAQRDSTLLIKRSGLFILGGYDAGSGTRNIASYPTILSGDISSTEDSTQNSYHVMVIAGVPEDGGKVQVDGFTIREGNANGDATSEMNGQNIDRLTGGGIHLFNNANTKININRCVLEHHSCGYNGGAMFNNNTSPLITNCIFRDNNGNYDGGAMMNYAASPVVVNCLFYNNIANNGGAIRSGLDGSNPKITNCTFYGNHANNAANAGAVFHNSGGSTTITNSIIDGNNTGIAGSCTATYSLVQGLPADGVLHNLDGNTDPQFTDVATNDFTVSTVSPTINAGTLSAYNLAVFGNTDLEGNIRVAQDSIDMGAYEQLFIPDLTDTITAVSGITACGMQDGTFTIAGLSAGITYDIQYVYNFNSYSQQYTTNDTGAIIFTGLAGGEYSNIVASAGSNAAAPLGPVVVTAPAPPHISINNFTDNTSCDDPNGTLTVGSIAFVAGDSYHVCYNGAYHGVDTVNSESVIILDSLEVGSYNNLFVVSSSNCMSDTTAWYVGGAVFPGNIDSARGVNPSGCGSQDGSLILGGSFVPGIYEVGYHLNNTYGTSVAYADETFMEVPGLGAGTYKDIVILNPDCPSNVWGDSIVLAPPVLPTALAMQTSSGTDVQGAGTTLTYINDLCEAIASLRAADSLGIVDVQVAVDATAQTYNDEYYVGRYFDLEAANNVGGQVTLYFSQQDFDDYNNLVGPDNNTIPQIAANGSNLLITAFHSEPVSGTGPQGYDTAGAEAITPSVYWNATAMRWEVSFHVNHFSGFFAHTNNSGNPLPVKMGDISAINLGATNRVDWNTVSEDEGESFEIERGRDGKSFDKLGMLNAKGVSNSRYSMIDATPYDGINYYRLRIVNNDNTFYYSKVVNATVKLDFDMTAYPNPVKDELKVKITGTIADKGSIVLSDAVGRVLQQTVVDNTHKQTTFSMKGLAAGAYFVSFKDGNHNKTIKVVKE